MDNPILFHVGYHKTGTTWMQHMLFTPRNGYAPAMTHHQAFQTLVRPSTFTFDPAPARRLIARAGAGRAVVSSEILVGNPFHGGRESDVYARRIAQVAPDARILITIREQHAAIASTYMQYLNRGGTLPVDAFLSGSSVPGYFGFDAEHFCYARLVALYHDLFGADHVLVLTHEALVAHPQRTAARIAAFAGLGAAPFAARQRVAASYPEAAAFLLRRVNHLRAAPAAPEPVVDLGAPASLAYRAVGWAAARPGLRHLIGRHKPVRAVVRARFAGRFVQSNQALAGLLGGAADLTGYEGIERAPAAPVARRGRDSAPASARHPAGALQEGPA
ncbi:MAG: hypothetical protein AcusKO_00490 [Acuticoccus sp.]